jgi:hypothetical protein
MSWQATAFVDDLDTHADGSRLIAREKLILYVLANAHNRDYGCCWLSVTKACKRALTSRSRFLFLLGRLESRGTISVERREGRTNLYRITGLVLKQDGLDKKLVLKQDPPTRPITGPTRPVATGPNLISNQKEEIKGAHAPCARFETPEFQSFWKQYPNTLERKEAFKAWCYIPFADRQAKKIIAGLEVWKKSEQWSEPRYIPTAAKFLRDERWEKLPAISSNGADLEQQRKMLEEKLHVQRRH